MLTLIPFLVAQVSIDGQIDAFLSFLGKIMLLVAIAFLIFSALCFENGETRKAVYAVIAAFILSIAVPVAKAIFSIGGGWGN
jgi:hypothetical protein